MSSKGVKKKKSTMVYLNKKHVAEAKLLNLNISQIAGSALEYVLKHSEEGVALGLALPLPGHPLPQLVDQRRPRDVVARLPVHEPDRSEVERLQSRGLLELDPDVIDLVRGEPVSPHPPLQASGIPRSVRERSRLQPSPAWSRIQA